MPPVTKNLLLLNILTFFAMLLLKLEWFNWLVLYPFGSKLYLPYEFRPYQLVTSMFMHGGFGHLFFNMFSLWIFGSALERVWHPQKYIFYYFLCGLGAGAAHLFLTESRAVGASGAIYGLLVAFAFIYPNERLMLLFPPIPIKAKFLILIMIGLELFAGFNPHPMDRIAHWAHLGGAAVGLLMLLYWRQRGKLYM